MTIDEVVTIEGIPIDEWKETIEFEYLTALHPTRADRPRESEEPLDHADARSTSSRRSGADSAGSSWPRRAPARRSC